MWRNAGPRYDCVMLRGSRKDSIWFAQMFVMFKINLQGQTYNLGLVNMFQQYKRHKVSDYLRVKDAQKFEFIGVESVVRAAHILRPTFSMDLYTVQDLTDMDAFLRLLKM